MQRRILPITLLLLSACGGGGDTPARAAANRSPSANAGIDLTVLGNSNVSLNGSGIDPDAGDSLAFAWSQLSGGPVTINNASFAAASFLAPAVAAGSPETLTFRLTVSDRSGLSASDEVVVTVQAQLPDVSVSGKVAYEFPPPVSAPVVCRGLDFANRIIKPIRAATVQIIASGSNTVLASMPASDTGNFSLVVPAQTDMFVRVRAELKRGGTQSWDVEVRNNVVGGTNPNPPPRNARPLYVLDGAVFSSGSADSVRNLTAATGWDIGSASYTGVRAAAPFSVLDAIYSAMRLIADQDSKRIFPPLDAYWSPGNSTATGGGNLGQDIDRGDLGNSFYLNNELFLLGMEGDDAEEFDDHVVVHEWGHYFEDNFSRSDSIGGAHGPDDQLDPRVAFGEGFATALSGMALNNPDYCDTLWFQGKLRGFRIDLEGGSATQPGWFDENSVIRLLYDLWDTDVDGNDNDSVGFGAIYNVMTGDQALTPAFTTVFSFTAALRQQVPAAAAFIDSQLTRESITAANIDHWASSEVNKLAGAPDVLPLYTDIVPDGTIINICSNSQYDRDSGDNSLLATGNKLSERRFLRMDIGVARPYTFRIATTTQLPPDDPADPIDQSDPDIRYYLNGQLRNRVVGGRLQGLSGVANLEIFTTPDSLQPGTYVIDLSEFRFEDDQTPAAYPPTICFDVSVTPS